MKLDRNALKNLLALDDESLRGVIEKISAETGLDLSSFGISKSDISSIRAALSLATDEDLARASEEFAAYSKRTKNE